MSCINIGNTIPPYHTYFIKIYAVAWFERIIVLLFINLKRVCCKALKMTAINLTHYKQLAMARLDNIMM